MTNPLEQRIFELGSEIIKAARLKASRPWQIDWYTNKLMEWSMQDNAFKTALLRFVDVLPALRTDYSILEHAQEYFGPVAHKLPLCIRWMLRMKPSSYSAHLLAWVIRKQVEYMAKRFIIGSNLEEALPRLQALRTNKQAFSIDLLGEFASSEAQSLAYLEQYLGLIDTLQRTAHTWPMHTPIVPHSRADVGYFNISVKLTALYSQASSAGFEDAVQVLSERLSQIIRKAMAHGVCVCVDMEDCAKQDIILEAIRTVYTAPEFRNYGRLGLVIQAYLRNSETILERVLSWSKERTAPLTIRLVKGAYHDTEVAQACQFGQLPPVWQIKENSDANYEHLTRILLGHVPHIIPAFASHNIRSLCHAIACARSMDIGPQHYELQALFGMAEPIQQAFAQRGYLLRTYTPIGDLVSGMGYLVRRLLENTSNQSFLRQNFYDHETAEVLLRKPYFNSLDTQPMKQSSVLTFKNAAFTDFGEQANRKAMQQALERRKQALEDQPLTIGPIIEGHQYTTNEVHVSSSPDSPRVPLAKIHMATQAHAEQALERLEHYAPTWQATPIDSRVEVLFRAAAILQERRLEMAANIVLEVGKSWVEADVEVAEAIDFLYYYGLEAKRLCTPQVLYQLGSETDTYYHEARGVCVTIGPWNFPCAIPCGMLCAALVTGNCAVMKPAEQSMLIAWEMFQILLEAGLPPAAASFIPGYGEIVGETLVKSSKVSTIAFTGSKAVGLQIIEAAGCTDPKQRHVKRVIAEMGGKNAIIVDADADMDLAVKGIVQSAFGYAGQKCSACSRLIVVGAIYEPLIERLCDSVRSLKIGPASDPAMFAGPVIDAESRDRLLGVIEQAKLDCTLQAQGMMPAGHLNGYYVPPTVFTNVPNGHRLRTEELFGPILAVLKVDTFDQALELAMDTAYGLAGAVYSRTPSHLEQAIQRFTVGNLYINRGSTGALVGRQPFGGAYMSGVGSKAGGPDYLLQFVNARTVGVRR